MQILSKNYELPQGVKSLNKNLRTLSFYQAPSFKSTKTKIAENLGKEIFNSIKLDSNAIKDLLSDPKKRTLFFEMLGATIVSTVANLVNIATDDKSEKVVEKKVCSNEKNSDGTKPLNPDRVLTKQEIKFDTVKGVAPQIEKDYIAYVSENFADNEVLLDRLKLLFNKFAAHNRKDSHIYENEIHSNKELLATILNKLKNAEKDPEKINEVINEFQNLLNIQGENAKSKEDKKIEIEIPEEISSLLNRYSTIKSKYMEIVNSSKTKQEARERIQDIDHLILAKPADISPEVLKRTFQAINRFYSDYLVQITSIQKEMSDDEKKLFFISLANRQVSVDALNNWEKENKNLKFNFILFNELTKAGLDETAKAELNKLYVSKRFTDIKINNSEPETLNLTFKESSINQTFENINKIFEIITGEAVNLKATNQSIIDKNSLIDELKKDFKINGETTYPNLIKYIYGQKHIIYNEKNFDNNQMDYRLNLLLEVLNHEFIFNPSFFSPHCKLRFLERFVLNENFGMKSLKGITKEKIRMLIDSIKASFVEGINIKPYHSNGGFVGVKMVIPSDTLGEIKITLDDQNKIHTIF